MKSELQARFLSVERILEYSEELVEEEPEGKVVIKPGEDWPTIPQVTYESVSMRYQPDSPLVIKNLSFVLNPAEKIGIVGRTGAGLYFF
jgi:ABC-type multidrug transport system fused ATPase/permease subunit